MRIDHPPLRTLLIVLALAGAVLAIYWPVGGYPFMESWDDGQYVSRNAAVQGGLTADGALWAFGTRHAANWHPLTWLSHMLDTSLFGPSARGPHATNVLLHALNAALLFLVLQRLTAAPWRSGVVAALFAAHPLHVESVAWVAERKDLLCALFFLLAVRAHARYAESPTTARRAAVVLLFLLGLLAKPMIVTLPFVLLLLDWWPLRRFDPGAERKKKRTRPDRLRTPGRLVREKVPLFALALGSVVVTALAQATGGAVVSVRAIPVWDRLANAATSCLRYAAKTAWPSSLSFFYPHPAFLGRTPAWWTVLGAGSLLAAATALALRRGRRSPWFAVGWLWFLVMLVPVIGLFQVGEQAMADRYTYLPIVGLFIAAVWEIADAAKGRRFLRPAAAALSVVTIAACAAAARHQATFWRSETALYERALALSPDNYVAHNNLGLIVERAGRLEEAETHYREAVRIDPTYALAHNNLALVLERTGRTDEAVAHLRSALAADPNYRNARFNLGNALLREGRSEEALTLYRDVIRADPGNAKAHNNAGTALMAEGKGEEALVHFREAVRLAPDYEMARRNVEKALRLRTPPGGPGTLPAAGAAPPRP